MAVPSSGQLRLNADINLEINGTPTGTDVSLNGLSAQAGFTAPNGMEEFYGYVSALAPSVTTNSATSVTGSQIVANGNVTSDGGGTITERGFYFGTNSSAAASNTKYTVSGTTGSFSRTFTGLSSNTTYYYWAYATNSAGTTIGSRITQATSYSYAFGNAHCFVAAPGAAYVSRYYNNVSNAWVSMGTMNKGFYGCFDHEISGRQNRGQCVGGSGGSNTEYYMNKNAVNGCSARNIYSVSNSGGSLATGSTFVNFSRWTSAELYWYAS
jgi:hypothetical protein